MRRYEQYAPSGFDWLADLPSHWSILRAKYVFREIDDRSVAGDEELLSVSHLTGVTPRSEKNVTMFMAEDYTGAKLCKEGDLVINTMWAWMGALGVSSTTGIVSPAYGVYRQFQQRLRPRYMDWLFRTPMYVAEYTRRSTGVNSSRLRLYPDRFLDMPVVIPSLEDQDRIVAFLDQKTAEVDAAIAKKERLLELLMEQRLALITKATQSTLDPNTTWRDSGIAWLGRIPSHFGLKRLGFISKIGNGSTPNRSVSGYWQGGRMPWLNSSKANDFEVLEADQFVTARAIRECHLPIVPAGSLVVAITGEGKTRGMAAITRIDTAINQHLAYVTVTDPAVDPEFLLFYLTGIYQVLRDESSGQGSTKGAITCGELAKVPVVVPPLEDQRAALANLRIQLRAMDSSRDTTQNQINSLHEWKAVLVADVVSGKIRV
jgi:type I restriction enzyme, S subunit